MDLDDIMLSDISQSQEDKFCGHEEKFIITKNRMMIASGWREGRIRSYLTINIVLLTRKINKALISALNTKSMVTNNVLHS